MKRCGVNVPVNVPTPPAASVNVPVTVEVTVPRSAGAAGAAAAVSRGEGGRRDGEEYDHRRRSQEALCHGIPPSCLDESFALSRPR